MSVIRDAFQPEPGSNTAPSTSQASFAGYDKPKTPMPAILEDIIASSPYGQMDVQELYIELRARYPYFRVHSEPSVWQNRVRNCLSTSSQFQKVAKPCAKRASFWRVIPKQPDAAQAVQQPVRKRMRFDSPRGSRSPPPPNGAQNDDEDNPNVMSVADLLSGRMLPVPVALPPDNDEQGEPEVDTDGDGGPAMDVDSPSQSSTIVSAAEPPQTTLPIHEDPPLPPPMPAPTHHHQPPAAHHHAPPPPPPPVERPVEHLPPPLPLPLPPKPMPLALPLPIILPATRPPPLHVPTAIRGLASSFQRDVDNACREDNSMDALRDAYRRFRAEMDALLLGHGTGTGGGER